MDPGDVDFVGVVVVLAAICTGAAGLAGAAVVAFWLGRERWRNRESARQRRDENVTASRSGDPDT